jgi:hypothetical protein
MDYFAMKITGENKVWKKYFIFAERFLSKENKEVNFSDFYLQNSTLSELKIQALNNDGDVVKFQSYFTKEKMPFFCKIRNVYLIREDIFKEELFNDLTGIEFYTAKVDGEFELNYKLLSFTKVLDCVDFDKSIRTQFDFSSKLVLIKSKIPKNIDGFFLSGWSRYGQYHSVVDNKLKNTLLKLEMASEFLLFDKIDTDE